MNKTELIDKVAQQSNITKKDAAAAVNATLDAITAELAAGGNVQLVGFGTFEVRERGARMAKNLRTGEAIKVPAGKVPAFKAGKALKEAVKK